MHEGSIRKTLSGFILALILAYVYFYFTRHDHFLDWKLTSSLENMPFTVDTFTQGLFQMKMTSEKYVVEENFFGSEVLNTDHISLPLLGLVWFGISYLFACFTYMKRVAFLIVNALIVIFIISLNLESIGLFGIDPPNKIVPGLLIILTIGPGYLFNAFYSGTSLLVRILVFAAINMAVGSYIHYAVPEVHSYILAESTFGLSLLTFLFLLVISEEIVFAILFASTQAQGKGNHLHFLILGLSYLGLVTALFLKKSGIYPNAWAFMDPFLLICLSGIIGLWSLQFKNSSFSSGFSTDLDIRHFALATGIIGFSWLSIGFVTGNDPIYESFHYLIIYAHLAFGAMFVIYIIANFVDALIDGHSVYKIAYRERNFPYATSRLVGFIALLAFVFMSNKEALELIQAARYNFLGDHSVRKNEIGLAQEYFEEGSIYGYHNHYSNYRLANITLEKSRDQEAALKYEFSSRRFPTAQSFVNTAATLAETNTGKAIALLRAAHVQFPNSAEIKVNLANLYISQAQYTLANPLLSDLNESSTGSWNQASEVTKWKLRNTQSWKDEEMKEILFNPQWNNAVLANYTAFLLDHTSENSEIPTPDSWTYNLHDLALLNNLSHLESVEVSQENINQAAASTYLPDVQKQLKIALFFNQYSKGDINQALQTLDVLINNVEGVKKGELLNLRGLLYLKYGAYNQAAETFRASQDHGFSFAALHEAIATLENGDYSLARILWSDLAQQNRSYNDHLDELKEVFEEDLSSPRFTSVYYLWRYLPTNQFTQYLSSASSYEIGTIWSKVQLDLINTWNEEEFGIYLDLFQEFLSPNQLKLANTYQAILNGHDLGAVEFERNNAFLVAETLGACRQLRKTDELAAYHVLVDALNFNSDCVPFHQEFVLLATELGLVDYAQFSIDKLKILMNDTDFRAFNGKLQEVVQKNQSF